MSPRRDASTAGSIVPVSRRYCRSGGRRLRGQPHGEGGADPAEDHRHRVAGAPDADRVDNEQLEVGQIGDREEPGEARARRPRTAGRRSATQPPRPADAAGEDNREADPEQTRPGCPAIITYSLEATVSQPWTGPHAGGSPRDAHGESRTTIAQTDHGQARHRPPRVDPRTSRPRSFIRRRRRQPPPARSSFPELGRRCAVRRETWPLSRIVGVALTPAAKACWVWVSDREPAGVPAATHACQVDPVEAGRGRDGRQSGRPRRRPGSRRIGWRRADRERPVVALRRRRSARRRPASTNSSYREWLLAPWNAASWSTIRSVPGVTYSRMRPLHGSGELAADRALEVGPDLERHRVVDLPMERPSARAVGVGCAGSIRLAASVVVAPPWVSNSPAITFTPMDPTSRVMSRMGEPRRCWRTMGLPELAEGRPAARRLARVVGGGVEILVLSGGLLGSRP